MKVHILAFILGIVFTGCASHSSRESSSHEQSVAHGLTLVFEGEKMGAQTFPTRIFLQDSKNRKTFFKPRDPVSVENSSFIIHPAWSPTQEWLLLPDGRFDGFAAFVATQLPTALTNPSKSLRVGVSGVSGTRWFHEFVRWKSQSIFEFRAGLSGQLTNFECELKTGLITPCNRGEVHYLQLPQRSSVN